MRRLRRLAIVLVAVGLVTSAIYATGAFSSLGTSRDANVNVAGDKAGYLGLAPGENGEYTTYQNGKLQLQLNSALGGEDAPRGGGVNHGAETAIDSVFTITNQGAQSVGVWLEDTGDHMEFERTSGGSLEGKGNAVELTPGDTVHVGLTIDTTETDADQLDTQLIVNADSDVEGVSSQKGSGPGNDAGRNGDGSASDAQTESDSGSEANGDEEAADSADDDEEEDTLGQAWEATKALTLGFTLGNFGMPGGLHTAKESSSPLYLLGQLLNAIAPWGLDMVFDLRDIVSDVVFEQKFNWGTALNAVGLLPVIGKVDTASDLRKITTKWMDSFPSQADEVVAFLSNALIKHLPGDAGAKLLGALIDAPVQKLHNKGVPTEDIIKYQDEGVNAQRVIELRSKDVSPEDIRFYVDEGIDLGLVKQLRDEGMKPNRIRFRLGDGAKKSIGTLRDQGYNRKEIVRLIDEGADLKGTTKLREQGFSKPAIRSFAEKGADMKAAGKLGEQGFSKGEVTRLIDEGADLKSASKLGDQGFSKAEVTTFVDEGADLKKASELRSQDVSKADINFYVENDMWLGGVSKLQSRKHISSENIRTAVEKMKNLNNKDKYEVISKQEIETLNMKIGGEYRWSETGLEVLKAIVNHNSWKEARENTQRE